MLLKSFLSRGITMNEKTWNDFEKTGKISDYLNYKFGENPSVINGKINAGEIKPAFPTDVGKPESSDELKKLHFSVNIGSEYADKNKGNRP